jgi:ribosomal protein S27AE
MMKEVKMICPRCGAEMNHHANKVDYAADEASSRDPVFDGIVEEVLTCPQCGYVALRQT